MVREYCKVSDVTVATKAARVTHNAPLNAAAWVCLRLSGIETVARSAHGVEQRSFPGLIYFGPQAADVDIDYICSRIEAIIPNGLEHHCPSYNLAGVAHEIVENLKFLGEQLYIAVPAPRRTRQEIKLEIGNLWTGVQKGPR